MEIFSVVGWIVFVLVVIGAVIDNVTRG